MSELPSQHRTPCRCLYVVGAGGHGREVALLAQSVMGGGMAIEFLVDDRAYLEKPIVAGLPVRLITDVAVHEGDRFVVAVGDPKLRRALSQKAVLHGLVAHRLTHPSAIILGQVEMGEGAVVAPGVTLTTDICIGRHVHINIACSVSHDVVLGDFTTLSPGVRISGHVNVGTGVFFGTGAVVVNGKSDLPLVIGDNAVVAAGACVTHSVEAGALMAGVPATRKR